MTTFFGKNIKYLRTLRNLTLAETAVNTGFSISQWNNWELNISFPKFLDLIEISIFFDISESDLIHTDLQNVPLNILWVDKKNNENVPLNVPLSVPLITEKTGLTHRSKAWAEAQITPKTDGITEAKTALKQDVKNTIQSVHEPSTPYEEPSNSKHYSRPAVSPGSGITKSYLQATIDLLHYLNELEERINALEGKTTQKPH